MSLGSESRGIILAREGLGRGTGKGGGSRVTDRPEPADSGHASTPEDAFYRRLIDGMRCGVLIIDREGRLLKVNDLGRQILDLPDRAGPGSDLEEVLPEYPQLAQVLLESFSMSNLPNRAEMDLRSRSSRGKTIGFTLSLVPSGGGGSAGAAIFFKDLTHVEHKEEQERLKDRLAALGQMAANLAHEIRNPLASIEVTSALLRRRSPRDKGARELIDKITSEVRRLNRTITASLDYVKPLCLSLKVSHLEPVLEDALKSAFERHGKGKIQIRRAYLKNLPPFRMDASQLRQVFENLFLNALQAIGKKGELRVEISTSPAPHAFLTENNLFGNLDLRDASPEFDRYVVVRVGDTGSGILDEYKDKIFYPFFTTRKQGSGVGLSMAKKIIDSHQGLIDVKKRPGGGTLFSVRIPLVAGSEQQEGVG